MKKVKFMLKTGENDQIRHQQRCVLENENQSVFIVLLLTDEIDRIEWFVYFVFLSMCKNTDN